MDGSHRVKPSPPSPRYHHLADGTTEEKEELMGSSRAGYSYVSSSGGGANVTSIQLNGSVGQCAE